MEAGSTKGLISDQGQRKKAFFVLQKFYLDLIPPDKD
jgi:hypothetical protein